MKRILVFLGLKVSEIAGAFGVFALLSFAHGWLATTKIGPPLLAFFESPFCEPGLSFWINGLMGIIVFFLLGFFPLVIIAIVATLAYALISKNWEWAERITDK
ncbi:hypothetical protein LCGC14_1821160 [marine sediment metagenome]|uniref:Uncharacterized protein n=1 Tax=marine sediment metagenome TaxID=412755 RepID=A0A0F9IYR3_9ZZZZ|nr:hypothetical protein [Pricia sp.]